MEKLKTIVNSVRNGQLDYAQLILARYLADRYPQAKEVDLCMAVLVNREIAEGHVCLRLADLKTRAETLLMNSLFNEQSIEKMVFNNPLVGSANDLRPLVLDYNNLYLARYYDHERNLACRLLEFARRKADIPVTITDSLQKLFASDANSINYQLLAAMISLQHHLCIISGGPGTGKTWTVSNIMALLLEQQSDLHIQLAAPTGKAAARMTQSIQKNHKRLENLGIQVGKIPQQAHTLHQLLGMHRFTHRPRYHAGNPLPCDVMIVDEASMVDQQLMAAVVEALPLTSRLILLGDKDQLSSVEAGSVFADLCGKMQKTQFSAQQCDWVMQTVGYRIPVYQGDYGLADQLVVLQKSHRFDQHSDLGKLATLVNDGDSMSSINHLMKQNADSTVHWQQPTDAEITNLLKKLVTRHFQQLPGTAEIDQLFKQFYQFQVLAAVWDSPCGVDNINVVIDSEVKRISGVTPDQSFYAGQPLIMTSNLHQYQIHNGDIAIIWPDADGELKAWFETDDQQYRSLSLSQLPNNKLAYAMTVHKSQGSEFENILLILPGYESSVCTRELVYTGITRAVKSVEIWARANVLEKAIETPTRRVSGLQQRLSL